MILKKSCYSDLGILEICEVNREEYEQEPSILTETLNTEKLEPCNRIETQNTEN